MKTMLHFNKWNDASWLMAFFGLAYFTQHFAQSGLISQPLTFYLKEVLQLGPKAVTTYMAILIIPWTIKPIYGLLSDFVPFLGYRRKSYLLALNIMASIGFLAVTGVTEANAILSALLITAFSTAASDVIVDSLMVSIGNKTGLTSSFQANQWLWMHMASVISALAGGWFTQYLSPINALHLAALITAFAPMVLAISTWFIVKEEKTKLDLAEMKKTGINFLIALQSKTLWLVIGFIAFLRFSPSFGMPLYYYQRANCKIAIKLDLLLAKANKNKKSGY